MMITSELHILVRLLPSLSLSLFLFLSLSPYLAFILSLFLFLSLSFFLPLFRSLFLSFSFSLSVLLNMLMKQPVFSADKCKGHPGLYFVSNVYITPPQLMVRTIAYFYTWAVRELYFIPYAYIQRSNLMVVQVVSGPVQHCSIVQYCRIVD